MATKKICDLHTHSVFSDGTCTPSEIIDEALARGLSAIALTDHNTVDGLPSFSEAGKGKNIELVTGAEFSVDFNGVELHMLGLFIRPEYFAQVSELMREVNRRKEESNTALVSSLGKVGILLDYGEIKSQTPNGKVNRSNIARAMMAKGYTASVDEAFKKFLDKSAGHYKEPKRITSAEIIDFLTSIHSLPVLAHPFLNLNDRELVPFIKDAKKQGLCGMECYYSTYSEKLTELSLSIAKEFGLVASGGSDFHGYAKPDIHLGVGKGNLRIPYSCYENLKNALI